LAISAKRQIDKPLIVLKAVSVEIIYFF